MLNLKQERILSLEGKKQAKELIAKLESFNIQKIYLSPAKRIIDTIHPFAKKVGLKIKVVVVNY
ncbi:histidine phosphatase family protein [Candidatus Babeliales bacterium]|nr:histidine phosphatase family protein [Candidatus Babeliales bacterium]